MKDFYFSIQDSLRMFLINKSIVFAEKWYRIKFNRKDIVQKIQKYQNVSEWNHVRKPGATNVHANILTIWLRHYFGMNAESCYWSYIDFYTLITCNYILADTDNSDSRRRRIHKEPPEVLHGRTFLKNIWTTASAYWFLHHILIFTVHVFHLWK